MFNFKKKPVINTIKYEYLDFNFEYETEEADKKYSHMLNELDINDEYDRSKKELLEDYSIDDVIYRYEPTDFPCTIKDGFIYDSDDLLIGKIRNDDLQYLNDYVSSDIVYHYGKYKLISDDDVYINKGFNHFTYRIKKEVQ